MSSNTHTKSKRLLFRTYHARGRWPGECHVLLTLAVGPVFDAQPNRGSVGNIDYTVTLSHINFLTITYMGEAFQVYNYGKVILFSATSDVFSALIRRTLQVHEDFQNAQENAPSKQDAKKKRRRNSTNAVVTRTQQKGTVNV